MVSRKYIRGGSDGVNYSYNIFTSNWGPHVLFIFADDGEDDEYHEEYGDCHKEN